MSSPLPGFKSWAHELSWYYKRPLAEIQALQKLGKLPPQPDGPIWSNRPLIAQLEAIRPRWDTADVPYFLELLRGLGTVLRNGADLLHKDTLVQFRDYSYGANDAAYPVTTHKIPWNFFRVPVTRGELLAAGYAEFRTHWDYRSDPFANVPVDGAIDLGPHQWVRHGKPRDLLRRQRGEFLLRLCDVIAGRVAL